MATALNDWLPLVIQAVEPWFSPEDIDKGTKWQSELSQSLNKNSFSIICLTPENLTAPFILFEAGALSKLEGGRTWTYLLDLSHNDVKQPPHKG